MQICSDSAHDEIVYDGSECPVCREIEKVENAAKILGSTVDDIEGVITGFEAAVGNKRKLIDMTASNSDIAAALLATVPLFTWSEVNTLLDSLKEAVSDLQNINLDD